MPRGALKGRIITWNSRECDHGPSLLGGTDLRAPGGRSRTSLLTWGSVHRERQSTALTVMGTTNRATAGGPHVRSKTATNGSRARLKVGLSWQFSKETGREPRASRGSIMEAYQTSGNSPTEAFQRIAHLFKGEQPFTSVRVESPDDFENLPARFTLVRKAGAWWLRDTAAPKAVVRGDRQ